MPQAFTVHTSRINAMSAKNSEIETKSAELAEAFAGLRHLRELVRTAEHRGSIKKESDRLFAAPPQKRSVNAMRSI